MTRDWSDDWVVRELARLVRGLPAIDSRTAGRLLVEFPPEQRMILTHAIAHLGDDDIPPSEV